MTQQPDEPSTEVPDADWLDQHTTNEDDDIEQVTSVGDFDADPADRIDQATSAGEDDEDDYLRE